MSTEQNNNDNNKPNRFSFDWVAMWDGLKLITKTAVVLVFIVNSVALGLYGLGLVNPDRLTATVFGAISFAFAAVVLGTYVNGGVKQQATIKRKR